MSRVLAYLRTSTDSQDLNAQKVEVWEYAQKQNLSIDSYISISVSSRQNRRARRIEELLGQIESGDTLIVTELSRLGRSTGEVIDMIDGLVERDVQVLIIKQNLTFSKEQDDIQSLAMLTLLSLFAEMERMMISKRTKEALAARKQLGVQLGKPVGTIQSSIYDKDRDRIVRLLADGVSARKISKNHLGYGSSSSLDYYIRTRKLRDTSPKTV